MIVNQRSVGFCRITAVTACLATTICFATSTTALAAIGPSELWQINADGTGLKLFTETPGETAGSPEWSHDGKFVAYGKHKVTETLFDARLMVCRADGTDHKDLGLGSVPSWSPDGKQIVFHTYASRNADGEDHIAVVDADGKNRHDILDDWGGPRWSPLGDSIFTIKHGNIARYDLATKEEQNVLPRAYPMYWGYAVSPDAKRICFSGSTNGLFLVTLDAKSNEEPGEGRYAANGATIRTLIETGKSTYISFAGRQAHRLQLQIAARALDAALHHGRRQR
jgi:dipeptidyl aminopeptidase/acylaminoacyl peptidase